MTIAASGGTAANAAVGSYTLTPSAATGGTFNASDYTITYNTGSLVVNAAPLTVTANNQSIVYGQAAPPVDGPAESGFQGSDTAGVVTGSPVLWLSPSGTSPGTYQIVVGPGTLAAANYTFQPVNGTLTISKAQTSAHARSVRAVPCWLGPK